jgi:hypothetical protein
VIAAPASPDVRLRGPTTGLTGAGAWFSRGCEDEDDAEEEEEEEDPVWADACGENETGSASTQAITRGEQERNMGRELAENVNTFDVPVQA